jgi:hypothetical protein
MEDYMCVMLRAALAASLFTVTACLMGYAYDAYHHTSAYQIDLTEHEQTYLSKALKKRSITTCCLTREQYGFKCKTKDGKIYRIKTNKEEGL